MKNVRQWSVARSGATMTIVGRDDAGVEVKITGVKEITAGCISPSAIDGNGEYWVLLPSSHVQIIAALRKADLADAGAEACIACDRPFVVDDLVLSDESGGFIHASCCGPERESYVKAGGEPLGPDDPIPTPARWGDLPQPTAAAEG